jgi:hypothetical protein
MVDNCSQNCMIDSMHYLPLSAVTSIDSNILVLNTSGDKNDLSPDMALAVPQQITLIRQ